MEGVVHVRLPHAPSQACGVRGRTACGGGVAPAISDSCVESYMSVVLLTPRRVGLAP